MKHRFQDQPAQRARERHAQLRRFMGTRARRKIRYGALLTNALDLRCVPRALDAVLAHARHWRAAGSVSIRTIERLIASGELRAVRLRPLCPRDARGARRVYFRPAMPIRKRAGRFQVRVSLGGGRRVERTLPAGAKRGDAVALEATLRRAVIDQVVGRPRRFTIADALMGHSSLSVTSRYVHGVPEAAARGAWSGRGSRTSTGRQVSHVSS